MPAVLDRRDTYIPDDQGRPLTTPSATYEKETAVDSGENVTSRIFLVRANDGRITRIFVRREGPMFHGHLQGRPDLVVQAQTDLDAARDVLTKYIFEDLAHKWQTESAFMSSPDDMANIPAYRQIVALGFAAVPLILERLKDEPDHWFSALEDITHEDPIPADAYGDMERMAASWVDWGSRKGLLRS